MTAQAILLGYRFMYGSLLDLHFLLNVATIAQAGVINLQEHLIAGRVRFVTFIAIPFLEGIMNELALQLILQIAVTL